MNRPAPYQSPLWKHLDEIRAMRRGRKPWAEISRHLKAAYGLETDFTTICNFMRRISRRKKPPIGMEPDPPTPHQAAPAPAPRAVTQSQEDDNLEEDPEAAALPVLRRKLEQQQKRTHGNPN